MTLEETSYVGQAVAEDLSLYGCADSANYICNARPYHRPPDEMPKFQKWMPD